MALWLVRKNLVGEFVGAALCIADPGGLEDNPGQTILDAMAALQLADGERLQPGNHRLWIDQQGRVVGYYDVLESPVDPAAGPG
jgi:hypothetical protein